MKTSVMAAGAALVVGAMTVSGVASAPVLSDFTVDVHRFSPVRRSRLLVADKLTGNYNEVFTVTGIGAGTIPGTFAAAGYWDVGQLVRDDGTIPYTADVSRLGVDYALYALFSYDGTFTFDSEGDVVFNVTGGSITLYLDRRGNTGKTLPDSAPGPVALSAVLDDSILGTAPFILAGKGHLRVGEPMASGDFGVLFEPFALTALGSQYFVAPDPFHVRVLLKGQMNSVEGSTSQQINGSADAMMIP